MQKALSPGTAPAGADWIPLPAFRNLVKPDAAQPEWNNAWYQTTLKIPPAARDRSVWLSFQHIRGLARLYINGNFVKELVRPDWEANISPYVTAGGTAEMRLYVTRTGEGTDAKYDNDLITPVVMKKFYSQKFPAALGLMGDVTLMLRGKSSWLTSAWVECAWEPRTIRVHVQADGQGSPQLKVEGEILDSSGKTVLRLPRTPFDPAGMEISSAWKDVVPWELGRGVLYTLHVRLVNGQSNVPVDELPAITFGFRDVHVDGRHMMMNGRDVHWRLSPIIWFDLLRRGGDAEAASVKTMSFLQDVGYNVLEVQPHPESFWSRDWGPWPVYNESLIDEADRRGIGLTLSALQFTHHWVDFRMAEDPRVRAQFRKELEVFVARYRNHPSILAWVGSMNFFDAQYGAIANAPWGMGREPSSSQKVNPTYKTIAQGGHAIEAVDPTRPAYSHHGGNAGTISSSNQHLCMTPVAELERWPSEWAEKGEKPWIAVEFGIPYWADFWMKNRDERTGDLRPFGEAAITEFAALTLGDAAYDLESEALRQKLAQLSRVNIHGHGSEGNPPEPAPRVDGDILNFPSVRGVFAEYGRRVSRSWRTWEVTGWSPWLLSWGLRYRSDPEIFMPDVVQAYREANQPFLAYIGGSPEFYTRQWNYSAGETVSKTAVFIWDGPGSRQLQATWEAVLGEKVVGSGKFQQTLEPNTVTKLPITFAAPGVSEKTPVTLRVTTVSPSGPGVTDEQVLTVWPPQSERKKLSRNVVLFDPLQESGWVTKSFPEARKIDEASLSGIDPANTLLIMGRRSLQALSDLPYDGAQIAAGLRVIYLEQTQADLLRLGFRSAERGIREGISVVNSSPLFQGLASEDFRDWRGSATLLPEVGDFRWWTDLGKLDPFNPARGARWGTHGNVTSVQIESPQKGSFLPLMRCGFDMAYTPLLEWRHGAGAVWFCQLDLTGRVGCEPAASRLATNLLEYATDAFSPSDHALFLEGIAGSLATRLTDLGFQMVAEPSEKSLRVANRPLAEGVNGFEIAGEKSASPEPENEWKSITKIPLDQIHMPEEQVPPPNLRRFRIPVEAQERISDRASLILSLDAGLSHGFIGVPLDAVDGPYKDQVEKDHVRLSRWRLRQLYGWIFTWAGVDSSRELTERLTTLSARSGGGRDGAEEGGALFPLRDVKISQALHIAGLEGAALLKAATPPDVKFADQKSLSASKDVFGYGGSDATGNYVDFAKLLDVHSSDNAMAIMTARLNVPEEKELTVRFGADYWGTVSLNGEEILKLDAPIGPPTRDAVRTRAKFKAGDNVLEVKVVSGSTGFGCWLDVDDDATMSPIRVQTKLGKEPFTGSAMLPYDAPGFSLYAEPMRKRDDPYAWKSW